jgi:phosphatidyl-myo-inositol alpha-mannosyltransferase
LRIALLNPTFWPEVRRGTERLVHDLAVALSRAGHEVTVLTSHRARRSEAVEDGFRVVRSPRGPSGRAARRGFEHHLLNGPVQVAELVRGGYDVAHAFQLADAWWIVNAARLPGTPPLVFSLHGIPTAASLRSRRYRLPMLRRVIRRAAGVNVLSEAAADPLRRHLGADPEIVPGAIFTADFAVERARAEHPTLVCAASLADPRKRGDLLLAAFGNLRERHPDVRLVLAGGGDPFAAGSGPESLPPGVVRAVADRTDDLAGAYASAWASVLPSVDEAFGLVLVESLAAGTPVVAARSGASPEVLAADTPAVLFEPDDESDLARALERALGLAGEPGVREACRAAAEPWDWGRVLPRYEAAYERAAAEGARPSRQGARRRASRASGPAL